MKTRIGFVSNSSSTSFTFVHKGENKQDLCMAILRWYQYFALSDPYSDHGSINASDVVTALDSLKFGKLDADEEWDQVATRSIDKRIEELEAQAAKWQAHCDEEMTKIADMSEEDRQWRRDSLDRWNDYVWEATDKASDLKRLKEKGFTTVHIVGFGDNHGQVSGGAVGYIMDYQGRYINMKKEDLVVFTEQNR